MAFVAASNWPTVTITGVGTTSVPVPIISDASGNGRAGSLFPHLGARVSSGTVTIQFDNGNTIPLSAGTVETDVSIVAIPPGAGTITFVATGAGVGGVIEFGRAK